MLFLKYKWKGKSISYGKSDVDESMQQIRVLSNVLLTKLSDGATWTMTNNDKLV